MRNVLTAAAAAAILFACASPTQRQLSDRRALAEARIVGPAEDCVTLTSIRNTRVRDDRTIDFYLTGRRVLRNTLPNSCPGLGFEDGFSYRTSLNRLCSVDIIAVRRTGGSGVGPSCGLGPFQPIELPDRL